MTINTGTMVSSDDVYKLFIRAIFAIIVLGVQIEIGKKIFDTLLHVHYRNAFNRFRIFIVPSLSFIGVKKKKRRDRRIFQVQKIITAPQETNKDKQRKHDKSTVLFSKKTGAGKNRSISTNHCDQSNFNQRGGIKVIKWNSQGNQQYTEWWWNVKQKVAEINRYINSLKHFNILKNKRR